MDEITQYVLFPMFFILIYVVHKSVDSSSFQLLFHCINTLSFVYQFLCGTFRSFWVLSMMYKASMNIFAQVSFYTKFLFLLGKCLVEFLSHRVSLKFIKTEDFPILHSSVCGFRLFQVVIYFWYCFIWCLLLYLMLALIIVMRWFWIVLLIFISWWQMMLSTFSFAYWSFLYLLLWSIWSNSLSFEKVELFVFLLSICRS